MPPKKLTKEEEAAKLLEEQRVRDEEERIRQEQLRKYKLTIVDGLKLPITMYYIETVHDHANPLAYTKEFLTKILQMNNCLDNFRPIDLQLLSESLLNDYTLAIGLNMNRKSAQMLINILFLTYSNGFDKFPEALQHNKSKGKSIDRDRKLFNELIRCYSLEFKYFNAQDLVIIFDYVEKGFLSHHSLLMFASSNNQRPLELHVDVDMDIPMPQPSLDTGTFRPIIESEHPSIHENKPEIIEEPPKEPTDEELLDPVVIQAIEAKLQEARLELEEKLHQRQVTMEEKITALGPKKKK